MIVKSEMLLLTITAEISHTRKEKKVLWRVSSIRHKKHRKPYTFDNIKSEYVNFSFSINSWRERL